ncbi:MAG TPA: PrsW family intramembrane metalloprotease [Thermoanaerobaculia bacterium]|nr:PrsW family intramembrane metalloprotease [Thermoanaerobaculia bacterium]
MRRASPSTWIIAGLIVAAALVLGPLSLLAIGLGVGQGFFVGLLMAVLPVPLYVAFALWVDRFEPEPPWLLVLAFVWGAAIAVFFSLVFNVVHEGLVTELAGAASASTLTAVLAAPFIEELTKGAALLLLFFWMRNQFDNVTDGIVYASMVGLGFAMTENVQYYGQALSEEGGPGAAVVFFLRGILGPFSHPLFTSMTGIGLGIARETRRAWLKWVAPPIGLGAAMLLHSFWNLSASQGAAFFAAYLVVMVPAFVAVIVIAIFSLRREARVIRKHLESVVAEGVLSADDLLVLASVTRRLGASTQALFSRGPGYWRARRRFHALATELAFHSWRSSREAAADAQAIQAELREAVRAARARLGLPGELVANLVPSA